MSIENEVFERSFPVGDSSELVLSNVEGAVEIRGWDRAEIKVSGVKRAKGFVPWFSAEEGFRATSVRMEQQENRVTIRTTREGEGFWSLVQWLGGVAEVDYVVRVPYRSSVVVDVVAGHLLVADVKGNVITRTVSAPQEVSRIRGKLVASSVSGRVGVDDAEGEGAARSVSGGIRVTRSSLRSFSGRTVSGRIEVETPLETGGSYEFQSVSGDVWLSLPPDTPCVADLQGLSGTLRSDLPAFLEETRRGVWHAEVNGGGGARVRMHSVSGCLRIAELGTPSGRPATEPAPAAQPETPKAAAQAESVEMAGSEERVDRESIMEMILSAVERGEMTVDEAAAKLAELDRLDGRSGDGE